MKVQPIHLQLMTPQPFWLFLLRRSLPTTSLTNTNYAVFGLGDSSYVKFNYVSKMLFNRLKQLGGTPLVRRGDGNDQHPSGYVRKASNFSWKFSVYGDFYPWSEELWNKLSTLLPNLKPSTTKGRLENLFLFTPNPQGPMPNILLVLKPLTMAHWWSRSPSPTPQAPRSINTTHSSPLWKKISDLPLQHGIKTSGT